MPAELVRVTSPDGIRLDGALFEAAGGKRSTAGAALPLDSAILLHGTGANFYASSLLEAVAQELRSGGVNVLLANTRGRDLAYVGSTSSGPKRLGAAYEIVGDCRHDLHAWLGFLVNRGFARIGLFGHSLGGIKAIYALSHEDRPESVACLCAISPAKLSYRAFAMGAKSEEFLAQLRAAEEHVAAGRGETLLDVKFPIPYLATAEGYLDKYGQAERYNILNLLPRVDCPVLVTFGSVEAQTHEAFRGVPEEVEKLADKSLRLQVATIAGADHVYSGARSELLARIMGWLRSGMTKPKKKAAERAKGKAAAKAKAPVKAKAAAKRPAVKKPAKKKVKPG
ncbi:MAG: alpha/beta fold hydrolase [Planctomycetia bacterium]|nr:alpha/beta fold hydrolase [Planctomycetia bacterium]